MVWRRRLRLSFGNRLPGKANTLRLAPLPCGNQGRTPGQGDKEGDPNHPPFANILPVEFCADLPDAGIARIGDSSEARTVYVSGRVFELCMVEDVEEFEADIEGELFLDLRSLHDAEVGVIEPRAVEEAPVGGAEGSEGAVLNERASGWYTRVQSRIRTR